MSNLINNDLPPPPDVSTLQAAAADALKTDQSGDAAFAAQKNLEAAQFQAQQFQERQAFIDKQNAPVYAEMRANQDKQTNAILTGAVATVGTLAVLDVALNSGPGLGMALSGVFGGLADRGASTTEPTTREMGPAAAFGGRAPSIDKLAGIFERTPPEETIKLGPAFISPAYIEQAAAPSAEPEGPAQIAARAPQRLNNAYALTNDAMSKGPKPPSWAMGTKGSGVSEV